MTSGTAELTIEQGATWTVVVTATDSAGGAYSLTGLTPYCQIRRSAAETTAIDVTCVVTLPNVITLSLTAAQTAAMAPYRHVYDVELRSVGGTVIRLLRGGVTVIEEVTRIPA